MRYRALVLPAAGIAAVLAGLLVFGDLQGNLVYWLTPTEAVARRAELGHERRFRLAGEVVPGTVEETADGARFAMTDGQTTVEVDHAGSPPQLFQPGIDVVLEGRWSGERFASDTMMIRHDEEYCAPDGGERHCPARTEVGP